MRSHKGVYKPQANYLMKAIRKLPMFHDASVNQLPAFASRPLESCPLVMPLSKEGVRVAYVICEYDPLIDSSDMTMDDWLGIGRDIEVRCIRATQLRLGVRKTRVGVFDLIVS